MNFSLWHYIFLLYPLWLLFGWFLTGYITGYVAREKEYPFGLWFIAGLTLPGLGLLAVIGLPDKGLQQALLSRSQATSNPKLDPEKNPSKKHYISSN